MSSFAGHPHRVLWLAPRTVAVEPFELREPRHGEVLVEAELSLISPGTERAFLLSLDNAKSSYPTTGGYSLVGRVVAHGDGVTTPHIGTRVVCAASHASHTLVSANRCVEVPDGLSSEDAAFFNLFAIALQGVRKARVELGEATVVFGCGLIGQCAMQIARLSGSVPVVALDLDASRRRLAETVSADVALDPRAEGFADALRNVTAVADANANEAPQVVIEATGYPDAILSAMSIAGWMARVVLLGSSRGTTEEVNFYRDVHKKGLSLIGAHASTIPREESHAGHWTWRSNVVTVLRLLQQRRLTVQPLITHRLAAKDAALIYSQIADWQPSVLGAILNW
jgi:2-desacetyl-2-hydroxyethyl bacteriochlorophyllide A dehydrogenase